jgi:uncharacterized membrane protein
MDALTPTPPSFPSPEAVPPSPSSGPSGLAWWRNKFLAGLFVAVPLAVTFLILKFIYRQVSGVCDPIVIALVSVYREGIPGFLLIHDKTTGAETIPGAAFVITILIIVLLGLVATNVLGKRLLALIDQALLRVPLVNLIYPLLKQFVDSIKDIGAAKGSFETRPVVYLKYPGLQGYVLGFLTGRFTDARGTAMATVFVPTAPNPITGFVLVFEASDVMESGLSMDAAWKMVVSAGFVVPKGPGHGSGPAPDSGPSASTLAPPQK